MGLTVKQQRDKIRYEKHITKKKIKKKKPKPKKLSKTMTSPKISMRVNDFLVKGVYSLFIERTCVYIGSSTTNVMERVCKHKKEGVKNFDSFEFYNMEGSGDKQILAFEKNMIKRYKPEYNITHNSNNRNTRVVKEELSFTERMMLE